jgi:hypothetical protein
MPNLLTSAATAIANDTTQFNEDKMDRNEYLVIDFEECKYSVKQLTDKEIAETDAFVIRFNNGIFEEQIGSMQDEINEERVDTRLLFVPVTATAEDVAQAIERFRKEK